MAATLPSGLGNGLADAARAAFVDGFGVAGLLAAGLAAALGVGAWLLLGLTGMGYLVGVHAFWIVLGEVAGVAAAGVAPAGPAPLPPGSGFLRPPCFPRYAPAAT